MKKAKMIIKTALGSYVAFLIICMITYYIPKFDQMRVFRVWLAGTFVCQTAFAIGVIYLSICAIKGRKTKKEVMTFDE